MEPLWTEADIATLKAHILSCTLSVSFAGPPARSQTFQSLAEMKKLLAEVVAAVRRDAGAPGYKLAAFRKGFD